MITRSKPPSPTAASAACAVGHHVRAVPGHGEVGAEDVPVGGIVLGHQHPRRRHRRQRPAAPARSPAPAARRPTAGPEPRSGRCCRGPARSRPRSRRPSARPAGARWRGRGRCRRAAGSPPNRPGRSAGRAARLAASGMPTPVSRTATSSRPPSAGSIAEARLDAARLGELDRVADEVDQHLPQPGGVADQRPAARPPRPSP